jgi:hypothetical protein
MVNITPEEAADIALGALLDRGFPMDTAMEWANCVKLMHETLADAMQLRESMEKNLRASKRLLVLSGGALLCSTIVAIVILLP